MQSSGKKHVAYVREDATMLCFPSNYWGKDVFEGLGFSLFLPEMITICSGPL